MPRAWTDVLGGVRAECDNDTANLLGATAEEGGMPEVQSGGCARVDTDTPS